MSNGKDNPSLLKRIEDRLPQWAVASLRSKQQWKALIRCWVATWAGFVLILPENSLKTLGNAAFFSTIAGFMVPANMPVQMFIMAMTMLVIGMCLGWGIGAAAMKAALAARNQNVLKSTLLRAQEGAQGAVNPDAVFTSDIFQGMFLDARSSVVYGVFLGVASFVFALIKTYRPRLVLAIMFAQIVLNIFSSYGPLFPIAQYTIVSSFLISVSCYVAIAVVCIVFVFPETMNHAFLASVTVIIGKMKDYVDSQDAILSLAPREIVEDENGAVSKAKAARVALLQDVQALASKSTLINVEFSYGRWNGDDAKALEEPLQHSAARICSFYSIPKLFEMYYRGQKNISTSTVNETATEESSIDSDMSDIHGDTELVRQMFAHNRAKELEHNVRLDDILPIIYESTSEMRMASSNGLKAVQDVVREVNTFRWKRGSTKLQEYEKVLDAATDDLRKAVENFKNSNRFQIVAPFMELIKKVDAKEVSARGLPIRSLLVGSSYAAQLLISTEALVSLFDLVRETSHKRKRSRVWAPGGLRVLWHYCFHRADDEETTRLPGEDAPPREITKEEEEEEAPYRLDPDSRPPANAFQKFMDTLHSVYKWLKSKEVGFAFKYAFLTIALWLPAVFPSSAHFYYIEKGFWALIMAQNTLTLYSSDQIFGYIGRLFGTFVGLVIGLVTWYIGNGSGNGNAFGSAASYGVFIIPMLFIRLNAPPAVLMPTITAATTFVLVVGYSWIDGHLITLGNPGIGWSVAWRRWVLITIGCVASFVLMLLSPTSSRKAVRLQNAAMVSELSSIYTMLMSAWITGEEDLTKDTKPSASSASKNSEEEKWTATVPADKAATSAAWMEKLKGRVLSLALQLQDLKKQTGSARFEGNIRGAWANEEYNLLLEREMEMLGAMAQLASALNHLDPKWRITLNHRTLVLNPNFMTDVLSTFALVSQSLRTGEPMHQILPSTLLDRLIYHKTKRNTRADKLIHQTSAAERLRSLDFMYYSTGICAVSQIIWCLDDMHKIAKQLCGEIPFKGFDEWKGEYDRMYREDVVDEDIKTH